MTSTTKKPAAKAGKVPAKSAAKPAVKKAERKAVAPILDKALTAASMSTATEDLLTGRSPARQGRIDDHQATAGESALQYLELGVVFPAADNPRANLGDLTGLAASIAAVGVLEPILVRVSPFVSGSPKYQIVAGHRRHAAAKLAGLDTIPCLVREFTEQARIEAMVIENLQRQDLSPFDEARGLAQLVGVGLTQRDIAERVGCSQSHVSKRLALTVLPPAAETLFVAEKLEVRQVEELAKVPEADMPAVVELLAKHAAQSKNSLLPAWAIKEAIDRLTRQRKQNAAETAGIASGLKRLNERPYDSPGGSHRTCKKADATHWYLGTGDISVLWARTQAAHGKANPQTAVAHAPSAWELREAANERIDKFIGATIFPAVTVDEASRAVFIASVTTAVRRELTDVHRGNYITAHQLEPDFADAIGYDDAMHVALSLLCGLAGSHWNLPALEIFVAHGYTTTGAGETFPDGFDTSTIIVPDAAVDAGELAAG